MNICRYPQGITIYTIHIILAALPITTSTLKGPYIISMLLTWIISIPREKQLILIGKFYKKKNLLRYFMQAKIEP